MAAGRYKQFLRLCENWPVDKSKVTRDLGTVIREQVGKAFKNGEASVVNEQECDKALKSLERLSSNYYSKTYAMPSKLKGYTGLTVVECSEVNSTASLENMWK